MVEPSALYIVREPDLPMVPVNPDDPGAGERLATGYVIVSSWNPGPPQARRYVVHAAPGADPIGAAEAALDKASIASGGRYDAAAIRSNHGAWADRVLWATWEKDGDSGWTPVAEVPAGATMIKTDRVPHVWQGQETV